MNKIVTEHYPASKLPVELREGVTPGARVTVQVEEEEETGEVMTLEEMFALGRPTFKTLAELNEHFRAARDEWD